MGQSAQLLYSVHTLHPLVSVQLPSLGHGGGLNPKKLHMVSGGLCPLPSVQPPHSTLDLCPLPYTPSALRQHAFHGAPCICRRKTPSQFQWKASAPDEMANAFLFLCLSVAFDRNVGQLHDRTLANESHGRHRHNVVRLQQTLKLREVKKQGWQQFFWLLASRSAFWKLVFFGWQL